MPFPPDGAMLVCMDISGGNGTATFMRMNTSVHHHTKEVFLHITLDRLLPPAHTLLVNQEMRTALLVDKSPATTTPLVAQQHFSPNELCVLVPLLIAYPHSCSYENLLAHLFSLPLATAHQLLRETRGIAIRPIRRAIMCFVTKRRAFAVHSQHPGCRLSHRGPSRAETLTVNVPHFWSRCPPKMRHMCSKNAAHIIQKFGHERATNLTPIRYTCYRCKCVSVPPDCTTDRCWTYCLSCVSTSCVGFENRISAPPVPVFSRHVRAPALSRPRMRTGAGSKKGFVMTISLSPSQPCPTAQARHALRGTGTETVSASSQLLTQPITIAGLSPAGPLGGVRPPHPRRDRVVEKKETTETADNDRIVHRERCISAHVLSGMVTAVREARRPLPPMQQE